MSDEEKKAYDNLIMLKYFTMEKEDKQAIDTILNLIDKQQKEIEEFKRKERLIKTYKGNLPENVEFICLCKSDFERNISDDYIRKDKIKAILEEYKYTEIGDSEKIIEFYKKMQSLLEKE